MIDPKLIAELRALLEKATPGEWTVKPQTGEFGMDRGASVEGPDDFGCIAKYSDFNAWPSGAVSSFIEPVDADLIASLRNHAPAILDAVEALTARAEAAETALADARRKAIEECRAQLKLAAETTNAKPGHFTLLGPSGIYMHIDARLRALLLSPAAPGEGGARGGDTGSGEG